jgi:hypothetical protein
MPKALFYTGTAFCLFLALAAAAGLTQQLHGQVTFVAVHGGAVATTSAAAWAIIVALVAGMAAAAILLRMAALLAARNLFAAFLAVFCVGAAIVSLAAVVLLQSRMLVAARHVRAPLGDAIVQMHFAAVMMLGWFVSMSFLALRPYFRIQASRFLSATVFFPLPLYLLILLQEMFVNGSRAALPTVTPASLVYFAATALLFFAIAVHCIRHRHMFLEMTNLRELLESRLDHGKERVIGRVAYGSE